MSKTIFPTLLYVWALLSLMLAPFVVYILRNLWKNVLCGFPLYQGWSGTSFGRPKGTQLIASAEDTFHWLQKAMQGYPLCQGCPGACWNSPNGAQRIASTREFELGTHLILDLTVGVVKVLTTRSPLTHSKQKHRMMREAFKRTVGGRCRKWVISVPPARRKRAACHNRRRNIQHGQHRYSPWCDRQASRYVHRDGFHGGWQAHFELHPLGADDQEAMKRAKAEHATTVEDTAKVPTLPVLEPELTAHAQPVKHVGHGQASLAWCQSKSWDDNVCPAWCHHRSNS